MKLERMKGIGIKEAGQEDKSNKLNKNEDGEGNTSAKNYIFLPYPDIENKKIKFHTSEVCL